MRTRTFLYIFVGLLVALALIGGATAVQTGNSSDFQVWMEAQKRTPLLWMVDGCAFVIFLGIGLFGAAFATFQEHTQQLSEEHSEQLNKLIERTEELTQLNADYSERITGLEAEAGEREQGFETEVNRLTEQAFHALQGQVEANARQLDAVNMAMQYQRAELRELRQNFRSVTIGIPSAQIVTAMPVEIAGGTSRAIMPHAEKAASDVSPSHFVEPTEITESRLVDQTVNAGSTLIMGVDFEVSQPLEDPAAETNDAPKSAPADSSPPSKPNAGT